MEGRRGRCAERRRESIVWRGGGRVCGGEEGEVCGEEEGEYVWRGGSKRRGNEGGGKREEECP